MAWFDRCHGCDHTRDRHDPRGRHAETGGRCRVDGCDCVGFARASPHVARFVAGGGQRRIEPRAPRLPRDTGG